MNEPAEAAEPRGAAASRDEEATRLASELGVADTTARALLNAGHSQPESIRLLTDAELEKLGVDPGDLRRLRAQAEATSSDPPPVNGGATGAKAPPAPIDGQKAVDRWMENVRRPEKGRRRGTRATSGDSTQVLKKWVDGDDRAMESWIQSSEPAHTPLVPAPRTPVPTGEVARPAPPPPEVDSGPAAARAAAAISEREATVVRWLTELLDRVKSDQFDPRSLLTEVQDIHRQLFEEKGKRKQLEEELEHVKRGSVAVIKYVRSREAKARDQAIQAKDAEIAELKLKILSGGGAAPDAVARPSPDGGGAPTAPAPAAGEGTAPNPAAIREIERQMREEYAAREQAFIERETEMRRRIVQLEGDVRNSRSEAQLAQQRATTVMDDAGASDVADRIKMADIRERELILRENELRTKFEEIRIAAEDVERKKGPLEFKEKELGAWESRIQATRQALEMEARRLEQQRAEQASGVRMTGAEATKMDDLKSELVRKEEELRARETLLAQKMEELESMTLKAAQAEAEEIRTTITAESRISKTRTGVRRLDDLLFGGLPPSVQVLVNGPAHTGKDVLTRLFIAEGLRAGAGAVWVATDRSFSQIREEMTAILPNYPDFERKGLVRYVDLYSRQLGVTQADASVRLLSPTDKGMVEQLVQAVNQSGQEVKEKAPSYRLAFESVSTVTAYLDTAGMFRFLQPFAGRRKLDGASSYYLLETGMHSDSDLQSLEHMMDGSVNLKVDQLKTFLSIHGLGDVQSRAWVGYTFSKKSFSLGSFSLDHIR
ncbi:MAG TPA: ATPase domain-containing protein [Thermoplasmata archaeon]|nr:ATPase domain-containing protein [Thermoplasmata archaeon]